VCVCGATDCQGLVSDLIQVQSVGLFSSANADAFIAVLDQHFHLFICDIPRRMKTSVRPITPFSADTDTPIFCCQSNTIPIRYRFFDTLRTWRRVTDRSKAPYAAAATNNSGAPRTRCSAAADAFDLSRTVKHSNYQ